MTIDEATEFWHNYYSLANPTEEDEFVFVEACEFLIDSSLVDDVTREAALYNLGAYYYEKRDFPLALKYYELAYAAGASFAAVNLGYIWYYGRTGQVDYKKAFFYFSQAMKEGNLIAAYKVADMYKNGYYVSKDLDRYKAMIRMLYPRVAKARSLSKPLPEIFKRLAEIEAEDGNIAYALSLYEQAKDFLAQRIRRGAFWGDLSIMDEIVCAYYALTPFDSDCFDFYDLFYLLKNPCSVQFWAGDKAYQVNAVLEEGACVIQFGDAWYRTRQDFFLHASIGGLPLTAQYHTLTEFEVL